MRTYIRFIQRMKTTLATGEAKKNKAMTERKSVSAHDVAWELRKKLSGVGDLKLHKLLYYCQGWHLAFFGTPMFNETIEAWANGPVVAAVGGEKHDSDKTEPKALSLAALNTTSYVIGRYGKSSGKDLVRQAQAEDPWREASESVELGEWGNAELTTEGLQRFFLVDDEAGPAIALARAVQSSDGLRAQLSRALESMHSRDPIDDDMTILRKVGDVGSLNGIFKISLLS